MQKTREEVKAEASVIGYLKKMAEDGVEDMEYGVEGRGWTMTLLCVYFLVPFWLLEH